MPMREIILALILISIILISGCVKKSDESNKEIILKDGLKILKFAPDNDVVDSNQNLFIEITLKNLGESKARDVKVKLYNPPFGDCPGCWEILSNTPSCGLLSNQWICLSDFLPPDPVTEYDGDEKTGTWTLKAPSLPPNRNLDVKFFARIHYKYETIATTQLELINRREIGSNKISSSVIELDNSGGPVAFKSEIKTPVLVSDNQNSINFCLTAENTGKGKVYDPEKGIDYSQEDLGKLKIRVTFEGLGITKEKNVRIREKVCFDFNPGNVDIRKTIPITITGTYNYYEDVNFDVKVRGV